ncbi:general substrate transporter, partial [Zopfochytrium polystomum]
MTIASPSTGLGPIYGGRAVAGLAIGAASNITPLYIAEIAPASFRGALVGMYELGWQAGGLVGFFINYGVSVNMAPSTTQWRIPFGVQLIPGGLFCITAPFLIESPRWLLTKGNRELALKNLATIRHLPEDHAFLLDELDMMQRGVEAEQKEVGTDLVGPLRQLFSKGIRYRLFLAVMLFMFQNGTAINAINYYSPTIIKSFGINSLNAGLLSTGIFGVIKTLGAAVWLLFLIDRVGRRNIFLVGAVGTALSLWWIAIYLAVAPPSSFSSGDLTPGSKSMLAAFYIWTAFYGTTWNGTPWVFGSEAFPIGSRAAGQAFVACANWAWNLLISRTTPNAFASIGSKFYFVFAGVTTLAIPFVFFLLPETRHIPLERVGELFDSDASVPVWKRGEVVRKRLLEAEIVVDVKRADGEKGEFHVAM